MTFASPNDRGARIGPAVLSLLQARLTDTLDLQARLKHAHWNVKGANFIALHDLFDRMADEVGAASDDIAERLVALGGRADGRPATTAAYSTLPQWPVAAHHQSDVLAALAAALSVQADALRHAIDQAADLGDAGTSDLFTGQSRQTDKQLWLIEAHLAGEAGA